MSNPYFLCERISLVLLLLVSQCGRTLQVGLIACNAPRYTMLRTVVTHFYSNAYKISNYLTSTLITTFMISSSEMLPLPKIADIGN